MPAIGNVDQAYLEFSDMESQDVLDLFALSFLAGAETTTRMERLNGVSFQYFFLQWYNKRNLHDEKLLIYFSSGKSDFLAEHDWLFSGPCIPSRKCSELAESGNGLLVAIQKSMLLFSERKYSIEVPDMLRIWRYLAQGLDPHFGNDGNISQRAPEQTEKKSPRFRYYLNRSYARYTGAKERHKGRPLRNGPATQKSQRAPGVSAWDQTLVRNAPSQSAIFPGNLYEQTVMPVEDYSIAAYLRREEEETGRSETHSNGLRLRHACHVGPRYAQKSENQDATWAARTGEGFVFGLADGVGTSMGARVAAALATRAFCKYASSLADKGGRGEEMLRQAVVDTHGELEKLMKAFQANPANPSYSTILGQLQKEVAFRLCENTQNPTKKHWGPVLATTFIGGIVSQTRENVAEAYLVRIGDGVAELVSASKPNGGIQPLFSMDPEELTISSIMSPGAIGRNALETMEFTGRVVLADRDCLLISSDGLARGHHEMIWAKLGRIQTIDLRNDSPLKILQEAAFYADAQERQAPGTGKLFGDNVSLVLISSGRPSLNG